MNEEVRLSLEEQRDVLRAFAGKGLMQELTTRGFVKGAEIINIGDKNRTNPLAEITDIKFYRKPKDKVPRLYVFITRVDRQGHARPTEILAKGIWWSWKVNPK